MDMPVHSGLDVWSRDLEEEKLQKRKRSEARNGSVGERKEEGSLVKRYVGVQRFRGWDSMQRKSLTCWGLAAFTSWEQNPLSDMRMNGISLALLHISVF